MGLSDDFHHKICEIVTSDEFQLNIFWNELKDFIFVSSQILQGTFCNFVAMVTDQNVTKWCDL